MKYDIFVSYRRADREFVASVVRQLEARGVGVWYDADIEGGADWRETIVEALQASDMLAIFFSDGCNNSRQLKKELAVADALAKPVVPILLENTQPRGAYLYELADRNWIQVFPDPMARIDELVEHLATLAGKSEGGLAGARPSKNLSMPGASDVRAAPAPAPQAGGEAAVLEVEQPLDEAVHDFISEADKADRPAPTAAKDYVGRAGSGGKPIRKLADIPPFKATDLFVLIPVWLGIAAWRIFDTAGQVTANDTDRTVAEIAILCVGFAGLFGAVVFPVRFYLRRRPVLEALWKYLVSTLLIFLVGAGIIVSGMDRGFLEGADFMLYLRVSAVAWAVLIVIAFAVYGVLSGQRAIRSFRSNIRKI